jgi:hypothetical protein
MCARLQKITNIPVRIKRAITTSPITFTLHASDSGEDHEVADCAQYVVPERQELILCHQRQEIISAVEMNSRLQRK